MKTAGQKEGAGLLERVTSWPWTLHTDAAGRRTIRGTARRVVTLDTNTTDADAELLTLAPDHALLLKALFDGNAVFDGRRLYVGAQVFDPQPDAAGCPKIDDPPLLAALRKVVGSNG